MQKMKRPEDIARGFQDAWNTHDMEALATLFVDDATFVNRFGRYVQGVAEIVAMHAPIHSTVYRDSRLENEIIDMTPLADGLAVVHFWSRLTMGSAHPEGPHTVDTLVLAVMVRRQESWQVKAFENVTLTDPRTGMTILRSQRAPTA